MPTLRSGEQLVPEIRSGVLHLLEQAVDHLPGRTAAVGLLAVAAVGASHTATAEAASHAHTLPKITKGESFKTAARSLEAKHIKSGGVIEEHGYHRGAPGFVAGHWGVKVAHHNKSHGKDHVTYGFKTVKTGSPVAANTKVYVRPELAPKAAATPAEKPADTAVTSQTPTIQPDTSHNPTTTPPVTTETTPTTTTPTGSELPPPTMQTAHEAALQFYKDNSVVLGFLNNCSGVALRDSNGVARAVLTAEHCYLDEVTRPRIMGSDGKLYVVIDPSLDVNRGPDMAHPEKVGTATRAIVPPTGDNNHDLALVLLGKTTQAEGTQLLNDVLMTPNDIAALPDNTQVEMAGIPQYQPNNKGPLKLQFNTGSGVGLAQIFTGQKTIPTYWVAINPNNEGVVCSEGESGGGGGVEIPTTTPGVTTVSFKMKLVGGLAGFDYWGPNAPAVTGLPTSVYDPIKVLAERSATIGKDLSNKVGLCEFAYQMPFSGSEEVVTFVHDSSLIPGYSAG